MKKAIVLCCMVVFTGCESEQGGAEDVLQLVQVNKLEAQVRRLEANVETQATEIERLRKERISQDVSHLQQTKELQDQITELQATIDAQKTEIERLSKAGRDDAH